MAEKRQLSVVPSPRCVELLGWGTRTYNEALDVAAHALALAQADNEEEFTPEEWDWLADALNGIAPAPEGAKPGAHLAGAAAAHARLRQPSPGGADDADVLFHWLEELDYVHAWALVYAVRWRWAHDGEVGAGDQWWRVSYRRGRALS